jgi:hypothetical protein
MAGTNQINRLENNQISKETLMRSLLKVLIVACIALALVMSVSAQDKKDMKTPPAADKKEMKDMKKMPTPEEQQKIMQEYMKIAAPGPNHKLFEKMAGEHTVTGKMWMGPGTDPQAMEPGTEKCELILGGRYLRSNFSGNMMGMPFNGEGTMAYDNFKKHYMMSWLDNMGTTISSAMGDYDEATKTMTLMGKMDEPMTGEKDKDVKYVYKFPDDKTTIFEIWDMNKTAPFMAMEMTYTKK